MATRTEEGQGYLPRWTLKNAGVIAPEERLPWGQTIFLGLQHVLAMFGSTVLAPIIMGFDPNTAIFFSGIGTLVFFIVVGGRVPSYLGSSWPPPGSPPAFTDPVSTRIFPSRWEVLSPAALSTR